MGVRLTDGTLLFEPVYDIIRPFKGDVAWASRGGSGGFGARRPYGNCEMMIDAEPQFVRGQTTWVSMSGKWGIVRSDGQMLLGQCSRTVPILATAMWRGDFGQATGELSPTMAMLCSNPYSTPNRNSTKPIAVGIVEWALGVVDRNGAW